MKTFRHRGRGFREAGRLVVECDVYRLHQSNHVRRASRCPHGVPSTVDRAQSGVMTRIQLEQKFS